jgi:hypothetical protein
VALRTGDRLSLHSLLLIEQIPDMPVATVSKTVFDTATRVN